MRPDPRGRLCTGADAERLGRRLLNDPTADRETLSGLPELRERTWTPKVCRIMAFYRYWAIILPTFRGFGKLKLGILKGLESRGLIQRPQKFGVCVSVLKPGSG